ncbi:MAG TPA: hypothetical protein VFJ58_25540 [Armatimonadota bacterium]|nr:hypothetical protein [Armatimonadota bacterium]
MINHRESPRLRELLRLLFRGKERWGLVRDLLVPPLALSHRNQIDAAPFALLGDRLGAARDLPMAPLMRSVVDQSLQAFSFFFPPVKDYIGRSPISPHGSMVFSVSRWGFIDWNYVRDLDWRIYLPPQIGHESGFLTFLRNALDTSLRDAGYSPLLRGKDPEGRDQVQLRDSKTGAIHGFHLYLLSMEPGFVSRTLHDGGGYSVHQTYFPEDSIDPYIEVQGIHWDKMIARQRQQYEEMFQKISFNTFGGDDPASARLKTPGWYSIKAFKWYASLAHVRGLSSLVDEILGQYHSFDGTHEEMVHLIRHHYYAVLDPQSGEAGRLERDLSFALSLAYARGRAPRGDRLVGEQEPDPASRVLILEAAPPDWIDAALLFLDQGATGARVATNLVSRIRGFSDAGRIRFADGILDTAFHTFPDGAEGMLLTSVWSFVFTDAYARRASETLRENGNNATAEEVRQALAALLASLIARAIRGN